MKFQCIRTTGLNAQEVMDQDHHFLENLSNPILHLYEWKSPSATYGYFIRPELFFKLDIVNREGLDIARRPTGGGILFHLWDFAFSLLIPATHPHFSLNTLQNYLWVNRKVSAAAEGLGVASFHLLNHKTQDSHTQSDRFCFAHPTQYDIIRDGKKIGGAAQRRTKKGLLHQGSLSLVPPDEEYLLNVLQEGKSIVAAMRANSAFLTTKENLPEFRKELRESLATTFEREFSS
jgi:lipoate-protein ligase A